MELPTCICTISAIQYLISKVFLTKKFGEGNRNDRFILVDDAIDAFRARLGTATLDVFDDDLRPYARRAEKDYFSGRLAE